MKHPLAFLHRRRSLRRRSISPGAMRAFRTGAILAMLSLAGCSIPHWPVDAPLSSPYGFRMNGWRPDLHRGVDIPVPEGTPVHAMASGRVEFAGTMSGYGTTVVLRHDTNLTTLYAHLSKLEVRVGQKVEGRQVIARSGRTGNARGAHLHFEVWRWGRAEDPVPLLGGHPGR